MRLQLWFVILAALVAAGTLDAQQKIGLSAGLGGEWTAIPGSSNPYHGPRGAWGGSATLELWYARIPRFALITRLEYAPKRVAAPEPGILSVGGGLRYTLATGRHLTFRASAELEVMRFTGVDAYNAVVRPTVSTLPCNYFDIICTFLNHYGEGLFIEEGWRLGVSLRPALQVWPMERVGLELTPAIRWLFPVSRSLPPSYHDRYTDPLYLTFGIGVVFELSGVNPDGR